MNEIKSTLSEDLKILTVKVFEDGKEIDQASFELDDVVGVYPYVHSPKTSSKIKFNKWPPMLIRIPSDIMQKLIILSRGVNATELEKKAKDNVKPCPEPSKTEFCKGPFDNQVGGDHYQNGDVPGPAEWCMKQGLGFGESSGIKYLARHERKGGLEDVKKAWQYCEFVAWVKYGVDLRKAGIEKIEKSFPDWAKTKFPMTFAEYSERMEPTAIYPSRGANLAYPILGLVGEAGEVAEKFKKILRDPDGELSRSGRRDIAKELGDVLWYICEIGKQMGFSLGKIASMNTNKLESRMARGVLGGNGDNR